MYTGHYHILFYGQVRKVVSLQGGASEADRLAMELNRKLEDLLVEEQGNWDVWPCVLCKEAHPRLRRSVNSRAIPAGKGRH